ncbi:MAG: hypothetical protein OHK93_008564 [Ramalina farinacea]|uniref:Uncharacterized protein n=1 Tax=Ramalina farinacea TaxID=258253 RepID=A0AA43TS04_9LECA|nr:hypothetical protein [Ramalina farinacea]
MKDTGLVYWPNDPDDTRVWMHPLLPIIFFRPEILPSTSDDRRTEQSHNHGHRDPSVGDITHYLVLDDYVLHTTHLHKVYIFRITNPAEEAPIETPHSGSGYQNDLMDLTPSFTPTTRPAFQIQDLQCSHNRIAILTATSKIFMTDIAQLQTYLTSPSTTNDSATNPSPAPPFSPHYIPAPPNRKITSLTFGDTHWHTLHSDDTIASSGSEPSGRGCLGLGGLTIAPFGGVQDSGSIEMPGQTPHDAKTIWFNALKHRRAADLILRSWSDESSNGASARGLMIQDRHAEAPRAMGDWFEAEGRKWEDLGVFFAIKIAIAELHNAALVLVDDGKVEAMRQRHLVSRD